jgi:superfamily I DNA/RNA helicase
MRGHDWRVRLTEQLRRTRPKLAVEANRKNAVNRNSVKVTTIESTLGQEFRAMFIVNATEGSLPSTEERVELQKDARLFYTAAGRARDRIPSKLPVDRHCVLQHSQRHPHLIRALQFDVNQGAVGGFA